MGIAEEPLAAATEPDGATQFKEAAENRESGRCPVTTRNAPRPTCYREAAASQMRQGPRPTGAWRLMRATNPRGGPDAVSIVHTADLSRSDADLAGLMLRCAQGGVEALVIVIQPRPPNARPWIRIGALGSEAKFEATIALPFTALLLPSEATALLTGRWRSSDEIAVEIQGDPSPVHGIVSLAGLGPALDELRANCPP